MKVKAVAKKPGVKTDTHKISFKTYTWKPTGKECEKLAKGLSDMEKLKIEKKQKNWEKLKEVAFFIQGVQAENPYSNNINKAHCEALWSIYYSSL